MADTMGTIGVVVHACDPILSAGVIAHLRARPELRVLPREESSAACVAVVVVDTVNADALQLLRRLSRDDTTRGVVVSGTLEDADVLEAAQAGAVRMLRRREATADKLLAAVVGAASAKGPLPRDLLRPKREQVGAAHGGGPAPRGLSWRGLHEREIAVLRLVADGLDTAEIARSLAYSERTVKKILHDVTTRLQLRNRSHAVAYALREGLI